MPRVFSSHRREIVPWVSGRDMVMIAKVEGEKNMVVVERVTENIYSMCTLKKDLKVKDVRLVVKSTKETHTSNLEKSRGECMQLDGEEWWRQFAVSNPRSGEQKGASFDFLIRPPESELSVARSFRLILDPRQIRWSTWIHLLCPSSAVTTLNSLEILAMHLLRIQLCRQ